MLILAIDPGATGAIAMKCTCHDLPTVCVKMPKDRTEIRELFAGIAATAAPEHGKSVAIMEQIGTVAYNNHSPASISKLNRHVGNVEMALDIAYIKFTEVHPRTWQQPLKPLPKDYDERKKHIKDAMQIRFPATRVTLWNADALAILAWELKRREKA